MNTIDTLIDLALKEDGAFNDITSKEFVPEDKKAKAVLVANKDGVLAGVDVFIEVFKTLDDRCKVTIEKKDGDFLKKGNKILEITGFARTILLGERTALNFLQYMSGIATFTNVFVKAVDNNKIKIYDTRKILPGYREFAKYAVRCGGGTNHRIGLSDMVLIKDNHLKLIKDLTSAISNFKKKYKDIKVEVECESLCEVKNALVAKADIIMLDNTTPKTAGEMIDVIRKNSTKDYKPEIEISGNVDFQAIKEFAKLDIDRISIGMITHSAPVLDVSLEVTINCDI
ncbi:MAG: carboxylating nicotinate-nucleotide diphosphorylase [Endomicrobium sp.]|jgi:nicotinate-nucleotide pyrophosphorylase (carboxylating)|nr:carboxylating nicotinate-nucleotide diphosphorylase [Endomicrobium sp.]